MFVFCFAKVVIIYRKQNIKSNKNWKILM